MTFNLFWATFEAVLRGAVKDNPNDFGRKAVEDTDAYVSETIAKLKATPINELDVHQRGFYLTCKKLGVAQTRKSIAKYLAS